MINKTGFFIMIKVLRSLTWSTISLSLLVACKSSSLINKVESDSWINLFNGKNLDGWTVKFKDFPAGENYRDTFRVQDGLLTVSYDNWERFEPNRFGHIFTNKSYSNNGVMIHSQPPNEMDLDQSFPLSAEAQLLGGNGSDPRSTGNFCSPGTNIIKNGELITKHCLKSKSDTYHAQQWVWFEAEVYEDGRVKHFINGQLVFEYDELQVDPKDKYGKQWLSKGNPLTITQGHIALQAETHPTQFRTIQIQRLH
jgi:hypothetical protein